MFGLFAKGRRKRRNRWMRQRNLMSGSCASAARRTTAAGAACWSRTSATARIVRLDTDDRPDTVAAPQLRACVRGRAYLRRQYHPDRLLHPLRRVGPRGEGRFERISLGRGARSRRRARCGA